MRIFLFLACLLSTFLANAQNKASNNHLTANRQVLFENEQLVILSQKGKCIIEQEGLFTEVLYLTIENKTAKHLNVSFQKETYYNEKCFGCDLADVESTTVIQLSPSQSEKGECKLGIEPLTVFSKFLQLPNKSILTDLKVSNVKIEEVKP